MSAIKLYLVAIGKLLGRYLQGTHTYTTNAVDMLLLGHVQGGK